MIKIILEDRFTTHQKITFLLYIGSPILMLSAAFLVNSLNYIGYIILAFLILIYCFLISIAFLKRGFVKIDSKFYRASFFYGKLFFKKQIDISQTPKLSVLKFLKSQKLAWFSVAKPDMASNFNSFEINILNEGHTKRIPILTLKDKNNIEKTIHFLTSNFDLKHEVYSPKINRRRRR